ncbi:MAG: hypothetical protein N3D20_02455 [Candidatus Pacearchaeota archaeon]|nr:hypothetical protein [Candidatus Pacearchaeota archaeon]
MITKRDFEEILNELEGINEAIFGFGGSGNIKEACEIILENYKIVEYLDEIARRELEKQGEFPLEGKYQAIERVRGLLLENGRLCNFIYGIDGSRMKYGDFFENE